MIPLFVLRSECGFERTTCNCEECSCYCRVMPGYLVPSDLDRLRPQDHDLVEWAKVHLRVSHCLATIDGKQVARVPYLVPSSKPDGSCHWLRESGECEVHADAPFGCAFFEQHMSKKEARRRSDAGEGARLDGLFHDVRYAEVITTLKAEGFVVPNRHAEGRWALRRVKMTRKYRSTTNVLRKEKKLARQRRKR
jgi:hypothetical protein